MSFDDRTAGRKRKSSTRLEMEIISLSCRIRELEKIQIASQYTEQALKKALQYAESVV